MPAKINFHVNPVPNNSNSQQNRNDHAFEINRFNNVSLGINPDLFTQSGQYNDSNILPDILFNTKSSTSSESSSQSEDENIDNAEIRNDYVQDNSLNIDFSGLNRSGINVSDSTSNICRYVDNSFCCFSKICKKSLLYIIIILRSIFALIGVLAVIWLIYFTFKKDNDENKNG
ncbi:hypothetical protein EDEG_01183 [Edhazardia aedis USNM 41457]|uniref:Uncharacterized protein n=1 Tax=Edhazardia aedis (strain USNM 41457) TaxID=1003232 RepID=J9DAU3_EDHAE|nr:hypothetical protein EDEG_01183 [Edhazardia aedis USNM 41457]|eukprot:EJW04599.1 hypothetical protein EDEG_01183 [Edhazardia aedis USNM 41457]